MFLFSLLLFFLFFVFETSSWYFDLFVRSKRKRLLVSYRTLLLIFQPGSHTKGRHLWEGIQSIPKQKVILYSGATHYLYKCTVSMQVFKPAIRFWLEFVAVWNELGLILKIVKLFISEERTDAKTGRLYQPTSKVAEKVYAKKQEEEDRVLAEARSEAKKVTITFFSLYFQLLESEVTCTVVSIQFPTKCSSAKFLTKFNKV